MPLQQPLGCLFVLVTRARKVGLMIGIVQRHLLVSGSLALLLFIGLDLPLGSRAVEVGEVL